MSRDSRGKENRRSRKKVVGEQHRKSQKVQVHIFKKSHHTNNRVESCWGRPSDPGPDPCTFLLGRPEGNVLTTLYLGYFLRVLFAANNLEG